MMLAAQYFPKDEYVVLSVIMVLVALDDFEQDN
jgi:hypothetical protein